MMKNSIHFRADILRESGISETQLREWEDLELVHPDGQTGEGESFYTGVTFDRILFVRKLFDLGYGLEDIQKIIRKVGLPSSRKPSADRPRQAHRYLTVGALAEKVGVSSRTIKHWEDKGIIEAELRSEGGFRLYSEQYVFLCQLILDLQLFGYTLEEIKTVSDLFRDWMSIKDHPDGFSASETDRKLGVMLDGIQGLHDKTAQFKQGIERWEKLLKERKKEIVGLRNQILKRAAEKKGKTNA